MPHMSLVVSNTSPLTNLAVIGRLELVRTQLTAVAVPAAVWREMMASGSCGRTVGAARGARCRVASCGDDHQHRACFEPAAHWPDEGESEAIALAVERSARLLLMDEKKGRRAARRLAIPVTGALGILAKGHRMGHVDSVKREIDRLRAKAGFFISDEVEVRILEIAGEK